MSRLGVPPLLAPDGSPLFSLRDINRLPVPVKENIYGGLIPPLPLGNLGVASSEPTQGGPEIKFICPEGIGLLRIEVRPNPAAKDCLFFVDIADTSFGQIELSFCIINDLRGERFDIDIDETGRENCFGTLRRNISEEIRAMKAGLSPHQVRKGLHLFSRFFHLFERFVDSLGISTIVAEPLSYANAIRYEGYGFDYITGKQLMLWIDREFRSGGVLHCFLDGSTPFRQPGMEKTVRGRSWAIHDGILGVPWDGVKIYKVPGVDARIETFPGGKF